VVGADARQIISAELDGPKIVVLNDADAAGCRKRAIRSADKDTTGVAGDATFGDRNRVGRSFTKGILLPNPRVRHLRLGGKEAEHAPRVRQGQAWLELQKGAKQGDAGA